MTNSLKFGWAAPTHAVDATDGSALGEQITRVLARIQEKFDSVWVSDHVLAFMHFPEAHWRRIYSTNVLERLNKEVKRRTRVVEIFPNRAAVIRLVGALLVEAGEEWQVQRRYFSQESMRELYEPNLARLGQPTPLTLAPVR